MRLNLKHCLGISLLSLSPLTAWSYDLNISIDTSTLSGTQAVLAFDFIDGDTAVNNTIQISQFLTDSTFDTALSSIFGDVSGLPNTGITLGDADFFNELLQPITLGSSLQFNLHSTNNFDPAGFGPDSFSFFILDEFGSLPIFATTDETGADALLALDLTGGTDGLRVYASSNLTPTWTVQPVPIPSAFSMMLLAGVWGTFFNRKHRALKQTI